MPQFGTTAEAIVATLAAHGVDTVFALPGVQTYALFEALRSSQPPMRVIGARHEQTVAYMAFGYAQSTGRLGVYSVVPGPGVLNSSAALVSAHGASQPVLCLTSDVPSEFRGRGLGHLHELPDQLATLRTITKWAANIDDPAQASELTAEAIHAATTGRPRATAIATPWDLLAATGSYELASVRPPATPPSDAASLERAAALVSTARNPMILVGGGAREAGSPVRELAEFLQAPVVSFRGGRGVLSDEHPLAFTCAAGFERWQDTDVVIGIGSRLELKWFRWPARPEQRLVLIDIDPEQAVRLRPDEAIIADAAQGAAALLSRLRATSVAATDRGDEFGKIKQAKEAEIRDLGPELEYLRAIREALPRDGYLVEEICQVGFASYVGFPVYEPRHFITCGHQGTLGFGYPTALGVQAAHPDKAVVSIAGDGGFLFAAGELSTAVQYDLPVVAVVFANGAYGNVKLDQERLFGPGHAFGADVHVPDFAALAESFGMAGYRVESAADLTVRLRQALAARRPAVIEVRCELGVGVSPWKYLMPRNDA
jgi:acetolactate synthase-1/2/3 large subunit